MKQLLKKGKNMGLFIVVLSLTMPVQQEAPAYVLEPVGIDLVYLPPEICPLIEGKMTEETGAIAGQPNSLGISFGCHYWKADEPIENKNLWIEEKLSSVVPPDLMGTINAGETVWVEGSTGTGVRGSRSLGLMSEINFTFSPPGGAMGRGRAYGIFRNGYSVLLIIYGPSEINPQNLLEQAVAMAVLSK
jgi:hypothetical protein